jgi:hypothetical protein
MIVPGIYFSRLVHPYMIQIRLCCAARLKSDKKKGPEINLAQFLCDLRCVFVVLFDDIYDHSINSLKRFFSSFH